MCRSTPGFIVNRVARPFYAETLRALEERVADAATLDAVLRDAGGFAMGPLQLTDLIGRDVNYAVTDSVYQAFYQDPRFTPHWCSRSWWPPGTSAVNPAAVSTATTRRDPPPRSPLRHRRRPHCRNALRCTATGLRWPIWRSC